MIRLRLPALAAALAIAGTLGAPSLALAQTEAEVMAAATHAGRAGPLVHYNHDFRGVTG